MAIYKMTFTTVVTDQHFVDGRPVFREEIIGVPHEGTAYFEGAPAEAHAYIAHWSRKPHHYTLQKVEPVDESTLRALEYIHTSVHGGGYHWDKRAA